MATYLPNVKKYTAVHKDWTPDFKFLSDSLQKRQNRYDSNYQKMNNLYGSVLHADLSHEDNIRLRDRYTEALAPKLQQISGVDFSLEQNVEAAKALFTPFFEDEKMVRDIVWTKKFNKEMGDAQALLQSDLEKEREKWWADGIQRLKWHMDDFKAGTRDDIMTAGLPIYQQNVNVTQRSIEALQTAGADGKGMTITNVTWSPDGRYMIETENGTALTSKFEGYEMDPANPGKELKDEDGNKIPIYSNPAQNYVLQTMMDDPLISRYYQTKFYVESRKFWEDQENQQKYGGIDGAKRTWAQQKIDEWAIMTGKEIEKDEEKVDQASQRETLWNKYIESDGQPIVGSDEAADYGNALEAHRIMVLGLEKKKKQQELILSESEKIEELLNKGYTASMNMSIWNDTKLGAKIYSELNTKQTKEADPYVLASHKEWLRFKNDLVLAKRKEAHDLNMKLIDKLNEEQKNNSIVDLKSKDISGNANANATNYDENGEVNTMLDNDQTESQDITTIFDETLSAVETYYGTYGLSERDESKSHTFSPNGIFISTSNTLTKTSKSTGQSTQEQVNKINHFLSWQQIAEITSPDFGLDSKKTTFADIGVLDVDLKKSVKKKIQDAWDNVLLPAYASVDGNNKQQRTNPALKMSDAIYEKIYITNGLINNKVKTNTLADIEQNKVYKNVYDIVSKSTQLKGQSKAINNISWFKENGTMKTDTEWFNEVKEVRKQELKKYGLDKYAFKVANKYNMRNEDYYEGWALDSKSFQGNISQYGRGQRSVAGWMGDGFLMGEPTYDGLNSKYRVGRGKLSKFAYQNSEEVQKKYEAFYAGLDQWRKDNGKTRQETLAYFFGTQERVKTGVRPIHPGSRGTGGATYDYEKTGPGAEYDNHMGTLKTAMNHYMQSANAIPGTTTFNRRSYLNNQTQLGGGSGITNYYTFQQTADGTNERGEQHINAMDILMSGPDGSFQVKLGDQSANWTIGNNGTDKYALELMRTYISDLARNKDNFGGDSKAPGMTAKWNENIGGPNGESKYGGWVIEFNKEYGEQLYNQFKKEYPTLGKDWAHGGYTITLFHPEDFGQNLNTHSGEADISYIEFQIDNAGDNMYQINNTGGNAMFWKASNGIMYWKYQSGKFDGTNYGYGEWTNPIALVNQVTGAPMSADEISAVGADFELRSKANGINLENTNSAEKTIQNETVESED
jgi:hypothetical protein